MREDELARYREMLLGLRSRLTDEVRKTVSRVADKAAAPHELSHLPTHAADRDSEGLERDIAMEANREQMLEAIDVALGRVADGRYGRCEDCGADISTTRLDALPFASCCVACARKQEEA